MNAPQFSQPVRAKHPVPHPVPQEPAEATSAASQPPQRRGGARFRRGVILGILISVLVFFLLQVLPESLVKELVLHRVQSKLGRPVTVGQVSVSLIPRIRLSFLNVASPVDSSADLFRADRIDVMLSVLSWLRGEEAVERLLIDAPWMVVRRDENGHWSIPLLASMDRTSVTETRASDSTTFPFMNLQITSGTISLVDDSRREEPRSQEITRVQASVSVDQSSRQADVNVSAFLPSTSQLSTISLVGVVTEVNPASQAGASLADSLRFSGAVQAGGIAIRQVAALFLPKSDADALLGTAHIGADVVLLPRQAGHELVVQKFTIESGAIMVTGSANFAGLGTELPSYAVTVSSRPVTIQQLLQHVPIEWIPVKWQLRIAEDKPRGTLTLLGATVTNVEAASSQPEWIAEAMLTDGTLIVGPGRTPVRDLSARIIIRPEELGVAEIYAASDGVQVTEGTAVVSGLGSSPVLDLTAAGNADAQSLIRLVSAVWPAAGASEAFSGVKDVDGHLDLWIHAAGPLKDHGIQFVAGRVDAHDMTFRTAAFSQPVSQLNGQLEIAPGRVDIETLRWRIGPVPVEASGRIVLAETARFHDVEVFVDVDAGELAAELTGGRHGPFQASVSGPIHLRTTVSGPLTTPQLVGMLDLRDVGLHAHGVHKRSGTPATVEVSARLSATKVLDVQRLDVIVPPARVTVRGSARLAEQPSFAGTIRVHPTAVQKLPPGFDLGPVKAGTVSATMRVKGESTDWTAWSIDGWAKVDDGIVKLSHVKHPLRDLAIELAFNDDTVRIPRAGFTAGDDTVRASGTIVQWRDAPRVELDVRSPELNFDLLSGNTPSNGQQMANEPSTWLRSITMNASVQIGKARYQQLQLTDVTGRVFATNGLLRLDGLTADTEQGRFGGQLTSRLPDGTAPTIEGFLKVSGVPVGRVLGLFGSESRLTGWLSMDGGARAEEVGPQFREHLTSLTDIRVLIEDGRIYQSPMIGKMLKLINLPALVGDEVAVDRRGIPFRSLSGLFAVDQGLVKVKELYLEGPVLKISGAGNYDAVADNLELAMVMNPLQSYSTLLGKIPLIGRLLSGEREGLGATLYEVTGPLKNPNVQILPAQSIGGGVSGFARLAYDILVNAAKLPADLLTSPERILEPDQR